MYITENYLSLAVNLQLSRVWFMSSGPVGGRILRCAVHYVLVIKFSQHETQLAWRDCKRVYLQSRNPALVLARCSVGVSLVLI